MRFLKILCGGLALTALVALAACKKDGPKLVAPDAYVNLGVDTLFFYRAGDSATVSVESNYDWDYSYDLSDGWLTVEREDSVLTVTMTADNDGDDREAVITVSADNGEGNIAQAQIIVTEYGEWTKAMVFVYTTAEADTQIYLPIAGTVDCIVDWGDGEQETVNSEKPFHTYSAAGEYSVSVKGTVTALNTDKIYSSMGPLTEIRQWGMTGLTDMGSALYFCSSLTSLPADIMGAFSEVKNFKWAFGDCTRLTDISPDLLRYAVNATSFVDAFRECYALESIPEGLFDNATSASTFEYGFRECTSLTTIPGSLFDNCSEATDFSDVFESCTSLETIPDGLFAGCAGAGTFNYAFSGCSALVNIPADLFAGSPAVTDFSHAFMNCTALESVPEGLFANNSEAKLFRQTFQGCTSLTTVPASLFSGCKKITNLISAFYGCSALICESPYDEIDVDGTMTKVHLYERHTSGGAYNGYYPDLTGSINSGNCFRGCTGLADYDSIPSGWK